MNIGDDVLEIFDDFKQTSKPLNIELSFRALEKFYRRSPTFAERWEGQSGDASV